MPEIVAADFSVVRDIPEAQIKARARTERKRLATKLLDEAYQYANDASVRRRM